MRKILVFIALISALSLLAYFNTGNETTNFRQVKRHDLWGPTCRDSCKASRGDICGSILQSCCASGHCTWGLSGQSCQSGSKLFIAGCTTD
ncbi:hypothetical protein pb186bvf_006497 [Paramecium bursaria]